MKINSLPFFLNQKSLKFIFTFFLFIFFSSIGFSATFVIPSTNDQQQFKIFKQSIHGISKNKQEYGRLGDEVLFAAYKGLSDLHNRGQALKIELIDLWVFALQGSYLFDQPARLWGNTASGNGISVGPWGLSSYAIKTIGSRFGAPTSSNTDQLLKFYWKHPEVQAEIATLLIEDSYRVFGKRTPYALQNYFSLKDFLQGQIGQGPWNEELTDSVQSGFYGKQILLGNQNNIHGLLYWLWVLKDTAGIKTVLNSWKNQVIWIWDEKEGSIPTSRPGNFALIPDDVIFCDCHPEFKEALKTLVEVCLAQKEKNVTSK